MAVVQGKIYAGCKDSSIQVGLGSKLMHTLETALGDISHYHCFQELSTTSNRAQEIKAAAKFWNLQRRPINAVVTYKDWLYSASSIVEGSNLKVKGIHLESHSER